MKLNRTILALTAVAAIAAPTAVAAPGKSADKPAKQEKASKGKGQSKGKMYVFRGTFVSGDAAANTVVVKVEKANGRAKKFNGSEVTFSLAGLKKLHVADTNGDGKKDLADVKAGDRVQVQSKLTKLTEAAQPFAAKKFQAKAPKAEATPTPAPTPAS
jgi:hypothetical protein